MRPEPGSLVSSDVGQWQSRKNAIRTTLPPLENRAGRAYLTKAEKVAHTYLLLSTDDTLGLWELCHGCSAVSMRSWEISRNRCLAGILGWTVVLPFMNVSWISDQEQQFCEDMRIARAEALPTFLLL